MRNILGKISVKREGERERERESTFSVEFGETSFKEALRRFNVGTCFDFTHLAVGIVGRNGEKNSLQHN